MELRSACGAIEIGSALIDFYLLFQAFIPENLNNAYRFNSASFITVGADALGGPAV